MSGYPTYQALSSHSPKSVGNLLHAKDPRAKTALCRVVEGAFDVGA